MPWTNPERWLTVPVIAAMLGIFWKGVAKKTKDVDEAKQLIEKQVLSMKAEVAATLTNYADKPYCEMKQDNITLRFKNIIQDEISQLKDEIFEHLRDIEKAIRNGVK